ncbi:MAG: hypothetical protein ACRD44_19460 [Bryobacteraceae bacterium]
MKRQPPLGLFSAGPLPSTRLFEHPAVRSRLGPVVATTLRVASRLVNSLGAGRPSEDPAALADCETILVSAPRRALADVVRNLKVAAPSWQGKSILLYQSGGGDWGQLDPLAQSGAATGYLGCLERPTPPWYVLEGSPGAVKAGRELLPAGAYIVQIQPGAGLTFGSGLTLASVMLIPLFDGALRCMLLSGVDRRTSMDLVDKMVRFTLRAYQRGGQKTWTSLGGDGCADTLANAPLNDERLRDFLRSTADSARSLLGPAATGRSRSHSAGG